MLLLIALLFVTLGVLIKYGKMYFLIAGYNTMSAEEKAQYNIKKIATLFRNVTFAMAAVLVIGYFLTFWLNSSAVETASILIAAFGGVAFLLSKANSSKYKSN